MTVQVTVRPADAADLPELARLYHGLAAELTVLKEVWPLTEALPGDAEAALRERLADPAVSLLLGAIDGVVVGFLVGERAGLLPQAGAEEIGVVRYLYTEPAAREVGVAEALLEAFLAEMEAAGVRRFDAHVSPGHRIAKNFFEANGFKARHIVMHREPEA